MWALIALIYVVLPSAPASHTVIMSQHCLKPNTKLMRTFPFYRLNRNHKVMSNQILSRGTVWSSTVMSRSSAAAENMWQRSKLTLLGAFFFPFAYLGPCVLICGHCHNVLCSHSKIWAGFKTNDVGAGFWHKPDNWSEDEDWETIYTVIWTWL